MILNNIKAFFLSIILFFTGLLSGVPADTYDPGSFTQIEADTQQDGTVRIMSFNVRCTTVNGVPMRKRHDLVCGEILKVAPTSVGTQEVTPEWRKVLGEKLGDTYGMVGLGRDGGQKGEHSLILYNLEKTELLNSGTFWLSETPDEVSMDWGAAFRRICTWAELKIKETGEVYVHVNCHLDHISSLARENGVKLILSFIEENYADMPVVFTGDFNSQPDSEAYQSVAASGMRDSRLTAKEITAYGTWHDGNPVLMGDGVYLDYVFVNDLVEPLVYKTLTTGIDNRFVSDHFPIYADVRLGQSK